MKKVMFILLGFILGIIGTSYAAYKLMASQVSFDKTNTNLNSENVQDSIDELATDLKNGKQLLAQAITNKGIETSATDSLENMANNIGKITSGMSVVAIGSNITSYNLDNISDKISVDLSTLTANNFYIKLSNLSITSTQRSGHSTGDVTRSNSANTTITYNASTHVVTIPNRYVSIDGHYTFVDCYANYTLYLIY